MDDSLFSDFETGVFPEWKQFKSDELFAKWFSEYFAHAGEELNCYDSILLIRVIMCHLNNMPEYEISSLIVINFMG